MVQTRSSRGGIQRQEFDPKTHELVQSATPVADPQGSLNVPTEPQSKKRKRTVGNDSKKHKAVPFSLPASTAEARLDSLANDPTQLEETEPPHAAPPKLEDANSLNAALLNPEDIGTLDAAASLELEEIDSDTDGELGDIPHDGPTELLPRKRKRASANKSVPPANQDNPPTINPKATQRYRKLGKFDFTRPNPHNQPVNFAFLLAHKRFATGNVYFPSSPALSSRAYSAKGQKAKTPKRKKKKKKEAIPEHLISSRFENCHIRRETWTYAVSKGPKRVEFRRIDVRTGLHYTRRMV